MNIKKRIRKLEESLPPPSVEMDTAPLLRLLDEMGCSIKERITEEKGLNIRSILALLTDAELLQLEEKVKKITEGNNDGEKQ